MRGLILTAGNGTRIREICSCRSKCMLPYDGRPLLSRQLDRLSSVEDMDKIHIVIHESEEEIQQYFGNQYGEIPLVYHVQHNMDHGLTGAIYSVDDPSFYNDAVMLALGDEFIGDFDLPRFMEDFRRYAGSALVLAVPTEDEEKIKRNYTIQTDEEGYIIRAEEKPVRVLSRLIGTGTVIFPAGLLEKFAIANFPMGDRVYQLTDLIMFSSRPRVYIYDTAYCNINRPEDYAGIQESCMQHSDGQSVANAFKAAAAANSDRTAVICGKEQMKYGHLDRVSDDIAGAIENLGYPAGGCIAVMCARTVEHFAAVMGILKAGFYYLPLDDKLPMERLQYMVAKAKAAAIIALPSTLPAEDAAGMPFDCPIILYDELLAFGNRESEKTQRGKTTENSIKNSKASPYAYIIFTSGSTGRPKGVKIKQSSLLNFSSEIGEKLFSLLNKEHLQVGVSASFSFDLSVQQIFPALLGGHTLNVIPEEAKRRPSSLEEEMRALDVCDCTPLIMSLITDHLKNIGKAGAGPKMLLSGGEEMKKQTAAELLEVMPGCRLFNCYGPTECTVQTAIFALNAADLKRRDVVPVGKPIKNTRVYVLNDERKISCPGQKGRIWIAGAGVSDGYESEEELTDKAFCRDILFPDTVMYDSGDIGYWDHDGNLCCCGRADDQIKYRGYRIEPGEIEKCLEETEGIERCRVIVITDEQGSETHEQRQSLTAFYTASDGRDRQAKDLQRALARKLPTYMIPQQFVRIEKFKINHNGKMDREALLCALRKSRAEGASAVTAEGTAAETVAGTAVETATGTAVEVYDCIRKIRENDICDEPLVVQGFDSLDMINLLVTLEEKFAVRLDISGWTARLTPHEIADRVKKASAAAEKHEAKKIHDGQHRQIPALPMQKYLADLEDMVLRQPEEKYRLFNQMIYFIPTASELNIRALDNAYEQIQRHHDAFSLRFIGSGSRLHISCTCSDVPVKPLRTIEGEVAEAFIKACGRAPALLPLEIRDYLVRLLNDIRWNSERPYELVYFRGKTSGLLLLSVHHLIFDYYSLLNFMEELDIRYRSHLPEADNNFFRDYASAYAKIARSDSVMSRARFWDDYLSESVCCDWAHNPQINRELSADIAGRGTVTDLAGEEAGDKDGNEIGDKGGERHFHYMLSGKMLADMRKFCRQTKTGEFAALFSLMISLMEKDESHALLFYTSGRSMLKPMNTIGFFSFLLPFITEKGMPEAEDFVSMARHVEKKLAELRDAEHGFEAMRNKALKNILIAESAIFDYQKLYSRRSGSLWKKILPYECIGVCNPFAFRIFDYGDEAEISVIYNRRTMTDDDIRKLVQSYVQMWDKTFCADTFCTGYGNKTFLTLKEEDYGTV